MPLQKQTTGKCIATLINFAAYKENDIQCRPLLLQGSTFMDC